MSAILGSEGSDANVYLQNANQKRKWDEYIDDADGANAEAHTHRRRARELDEQRDENVELAY